jgi:hypothetical protein
MVRFSLQRGKTFVSLACFGFTGCALVVDLPEPYDQNVTEAGINGSGGTTASGGSAGADATSSGNSSSGGGVASGGAANGGTAGSGDGSAGQMAIDAGTEGGADSGCVAICDCDGDTFRAEGECLGDDCDDADARVHPMQLVYFAEESVGGGWDFDFNTEEEKSPDLVKSAPNCDIPLGLLCPVTEAGYVAGAPQCGVTADWGTCVANGTSCTRSLTDQTMACR